MALWQAALIGLFAYLGRNQTPWLFGTTGGWYGIGRPLVAGLITGMILGDITTGVLSGVAVQAIFIGQITPGGAVPSDLNLAAYVGIPLAIVAGGNPATAVAFAIPLGALGVGLHNFTMTFNSVFAHRADTYAEKGDAAGVRKMNILGNSTAFIERFTIVTLTLYYGGTFAENLLAALPQVVLDFFQVAGQLLPALGFALLLKQILDVKWMLIFFISGWVIASSFDITTTTLTILAGTVALIYVNARYNGGKTATSTAGDANGNVYEDKEGNYEEW